MEHHLDLRLPHPRGRLDRGAGGGVHARQRARVRAGGARGGAGDRRVRPAPLVLLQRAQQLPRGGREVPGGAPDVGADDARGVRRPDPRSWLLRFHTQTAGSTLTAQQPENNVVRVADPGDGGGGGRHAVAAHQRHGRGARAAHRGLGARRAAHPAGRSPTSPGSPTSSTRSGGAWVVEAWTDRIEAEARAYLEKIEAMGGALAAIERGFQQREIHEAAYRTQRAIEAGEQVVVGVNRFQRRAARSGSRRSAWTRRCSSDAGRSVWRRCGAARRGAGARGARGARGRGARQRQPDAADRRGRGGVRLARRDRGRAGARCSASTGRGWRCENKAMGTGHRAHGRIRRVLGPPGFGVRANRPRACSLVLVAAPAFAQERATLTVLFTSDMHAHVLPFDDVREKPAPARSPRSATLIARVRGENPRTVVLDGGDAIQGTPLGLLRDRRRPARPVRTRRSRR